MRLSILVLIFTIAFASCNNGTDNSFVMSDNNMEETISLGASVSFAKFEALKRNDVIVFENPMTKKLTCLRIVGLPGDVVEIINGEIFLNKVPFVLPNSSKRIYTVYSKNNNFSKVLKYQFKEYSESYGMVAITADQFKEIRNNSLVDSIYQLGFDSIYVYPEIVKTQNSKRFNHFYFGPLEIPEVNDTISEIDKMLVSNFINFSGDYLQVKQALYFCIGDRFSDAMDSRVIGLSPQSAVIGKVNLVRNATVINISSDAR